MATSNLSLSSHQLCVRCVCAPPGRVSTLVCTQAREQPRLAHKIPRHRLQRTQLLGEFCRPSERGPKRDDVDGLASTCSHTTAMPPVRTEVGGAQGEVLAGSCVITYQAPLQRMNRNGMGSERQSRQPFDEHASETAVTSTRALACFSRMLSRFHGAHREMRQRPGVA